MKASLLLFCLAIAIPSFGQHISIQNTSADFLIGDKKFGAASGAEVYKQLLGAASRTNNFEASSIYFFDSHGMAITVNRESGKVEDVVFKFIPTDDKRSPNKAFNGMLSIDGVVVPASTNFVELKQLLTNSKPEEFRDLYLKFDQPGFHVLAGFNGEGKLDKVVVSFVP